MILLTRRNQAAFYLNPDLIKIIEETPDTLIELTNGERLLVQESAETIVERIVAYRTRLQQQLPEKHKPAA